MRETTTSTPIALDVRGRGSHYDPDVHEPHPLHGARLTLPTGQHLALAPASVFDGGSRARNARSPSGGRGANGIHLSAPSH